MHIPEDEGNIIVVDLDGKAEKLKKVLTESKFFENMESGKKSIRVVQIGHPGIKATEVAETKLIVMELKRRYPENVIIMVPLE